MPHRTTSTFVGPGATGADLLLVNGNVLTMNATDAAAPEATAVLVRGRTIRAVGTAEDLRPLLAPGGRTVDLGGATVLPGFHDSHLHLCSLGFELSQLDLSEAESLEAALALVAERSASLRTGQLLKATGFSLARWSLQAVDRHSLDGAAGGRPVVVQSQDHHSAWLSSAALDLLGITAATPDPEHGTIVREAGGQPSGLLLERATRLIDEGLPRPAASDVRDALRRAGAHLAGRGVTTVHHMAMETAAEWREMASLASGPGYELRVWACVDQENVEHAAALGLASGQGGTGFEVGGAKFFVDGALGSRTAWMLEPYADGSGTGTTVHGPDVLLERFPYVISEGFVPVVHAIGDAATRAALDAFEGTRELWAPQGLRPRLEHAQHLAPEDVGRAAALGVVVSPQPIHLTFDLHAIRELLPDRTERAYAFRRLLDSGAVLAFGSDAPVAKPDVFAGLRAAVTRADPSGEVLNESENLTMNAALAAYTRGAAYAIGREGWSGQLREGFAADLVVLSHAPRADGPDPEVLATLKAGEVTHGSGQLDLG